MFYRKEMLCCFLLLFTLSSCVTQPFLVNVTQSSYHAEENHSITLEWRFPTRTGGSLNSIYILCELLTGPSVLFQFQEGVELSASRHKRFAGRVQFNIDFFRRERLRLNISRLRIEDSGDYKCKVNAGDGFASEKCHLKVTAARDRTKPETPSTTSGGGAPYPTISPSKSNSLVWIASCCVLGLLILLYLCFCFCLCKEHFRVCDSNDSNDSNTVINSSCKNKYEREVRERI